MSDFVRPAELLHLPELLARVEEEAEDIFDPKAVLEVVLAVEEILMNVISHAYPDAKGEVRIRIEKLDSASGLRLTVLDDGIAFDPLAAIEPDVDAPLEERNVGGLGILLVKRMMDRVVYERRNGENRLIMEKMASNAQLEERKS